MRTNIFAPCILLTACLATPSSDEASGTSSDTANTSHPTTTGVLPPSCVEDNICAPNDGESTQNCPRDCFGCGDGAKLDNEDCDDGNNVEEDECPSGPLGQCKAKAFCGDGFVQKGMEQCDDKNQFSGDGCESDCTPTTVCGNGIMETGELCDDSNVVNGDGCESNCTPTLVCGNGVMENGELCDDGNFMNGDGCESNCTPTPVCGNGVMENGELCDDGNFMNDDGCESNCTPTPVCGNGIIESGEGCDDKNLIQNDGCSDICELECIVFVSSAGFNGNLGGLTGGDAKCSNAASAAGLYGTYRAWLSVSMNSAKDRLKPCGSAVILRDGTKVADSWVSFTTGAHNSSISLNEMNKPNELDKVWTGTREDGTFALANCTDWTFDDLMMNSQINGKNGLSSQSDNSWTNDGNKECYNTLHLYCVQQPTL